MRSWLFVPATDHRRLEKASKTAAYACIVDLEDALGPSEKAEGRATLTEWVPAIDWGDTLVFTRIDVYGSWREDLEAGFAAEVDGVVIPKVSDPELLESVLSVIDARRSDLQVATMLEDPRGVTDAIGLMGRVNGLVAALWGVEDFSQSLGVRNHIDADGSSAFVVRTARSMVQVAASAMGVPLIDAPHMVVDDVEGLERGVAEAAREGLGGKLAIHPSQVPIINAGFDVTDGEVEWAKAVLEATGDGSGLALVNGRVVDRPHIMRAQAIIEATNS